MRYVLFSFIILASFIPAPAQAGFYGPIVSEECKCKSVQIENGSGTVSSAPAYGCILQSLQYVIRILITIGFVLMTLALVYAGFVWMTSAGNPGKIEQGKHLIVNTLLGIFIILGAWLLIDFVMKTIYNEDPERSFGPWNNILAGSGTSGSRCLVARQPASLTNGDLNIVQGMPSGVGSGVGVHTPGVMTNEDARRTLTAAGVAIAAPSLTNTRIDTINQAVAIKVACGCTVQVNSTTSGTHATTGTLNHANGYKVDLQATTDLTNWIRGHLIASGSRTGDHGGPRYLDGCGNEYVHEVDLHHWDVTVSRGSCNLVGPGTSGAGGGGGGASGW